MQVSALGSVALARLEWEEDVRTATPRVCLLNVDESGSMSKQMRRNLELYKHPCIDDGAQCVATHAHGMHATCVRFSCDGRRLFTVGGKDRTLKQWKIVEGSA